jgi:hypothetical protein
MTKKIFIVIASTQRLDTYEVHAATEAEAWQTWSQGKLLESGTDVLVEALDIQEVRRPLRQPSRGT